MTLRQQITLVTTELGSPVLKPNLPTKKTSTSIAIFIWYTGRHFHWRRLELHEN